MRCFLFHVRNTPRDDVGQARTRTLNFRMEVRNANRLAIAAAYITCREKTADVNFFSIILILSWPVLESITIRT